MSNTLTNVPTMSIGKASKTLANAYISIINKGLPINTMPSVMLWGQPGVGKSQGIRQIAELIEKKTKKKVNITDVRLLLFNPVDLRGIPTSNKDKTLAVWLRPKIFDMDNSEEVINILFLDEISSAPASVQAAAYQITLDRTVGEHKLPDNCIVIAAGNRVTDKSVSYKMPKALANRLLHIDIESNLESWRKWAISKGINEKVIGFLSFSRSKLNEFNTKEDDLAFATPRSWELVSNIINGFDGDFDSLMDLIAGLVGTGTAMEFRTWMSVYDKLPNIEDIFDGKKVEMPKANDVLYALSTSMVSYVREHQNETDRITNSIKFANTMPAEYSVLTLKDYLYISYELKLSLLKNREYAKWLNEKGALLNDIN